jgi:hypothetical protein
MAAPPATVDSVQLFANFKEVYGEDFVRMSMVDKQLQEDFAFKEGDEPGRAYIESIRMTEEQGFTFGLAGQSGRRLLNDSIAMKTERTTVVGDIIEFKSEVNLEAILRGGNSKQAFRETIGMVQEAQRDSVFFHTEHSLLRGGLPVGQITALAADPGGVAARRLVTLSTSYYADAFWSNSENMPLDIYDSTSATLSGTAVRRNTVVGGTLGLFRVISWLPDTRQLLIEADTSTDWTAGTGGNPVIVGDCLWRTGSYRTESLGMLAICQSTNQTIFGISQSTYGKWNAYRDTAGGPATMNRIQRTIANIRGRSAMKGNYVARMHPLQWEAVHNDIVALRRYDSSYKVTRAEAGHSEIQFYSAAGTVTLKSNVYMPLDSILITDDNTWSRRGVTDVIFTMAVKGADGLPMMYVVNTNSSSVQFRAYGQQTMFCNRLNRNAVLTGLDIPA